MYRDEQLPWGEIDLDGHLIPSSITPSEKWILQKLAQDQYVLEIGSAYGYSTIILAQVAAHVTAVDPHQGELPGSWEAIHENLKIHNIRNVDIVRGYSEHVLPRLIDKDRQYGLIFIDGCHEAPIVEQDVNNALALLSPEGVIAVHDYDWGFPEVSRVCDALGKPILLADSIWVGK